MANGELGRARWWEVRRAHNLKPVTYRCPLCGERLPALSDHLLMLPEGQSAGRRHAHTDCVLAARRAGRLPTRGEWRAAEAKNRPRRERRAAQAKKLSAWRRTLGVLRAWRGR
jgi:hypothetical protein